MGVSHEIVRPQLVRPARARAFHPARLARMHDVMRRAVDSGWVPGLVTLVSRRGETHVDAIGTLAFDHPAPMRRDTIFRLASMTKPIMAVAAMILVEECSVRLDDPVESLLPELANRKVVRTPAGALADTVPAKRPITLRDLLMFQSGYGEIALLAPGSPLHQAQIAAELPLATWPFPGNDDELMKRVGALPLAFQPGERWAYHLSGEILGVLVARASGKSLGAFMRERIFEPLGMRDTDFIVPEEKMSRFPPCYRGNPSTKQTEIHDPVRGIYAKRAFEGGAGGLVSTVDDLLAFGEMLANDGAHAGVRILSRTTVELVTRDHVTAEQKSVSPFFPNFWDTCGWGLGMGVITHRKDVGRGVGSFGWDGAFSTSFWIDPVEHVIGILMLQRSPDTLALPAIVGDFWTSAYQAIND